MKLWVARSDRISGLSSTRVGTIYWSRKVGSDTDGDPQLWRALSTPCQMPDEQGEHQTSSHQEDWVFLWLVGEPHPGRGCWGHSVPTPTSTLQPHRGFSEPFGEL